jgi:methylmalonyl-CoA mutase
MSKVNLMSASKPPSTPQPLLSEFAPVDYAAWRKLVEAELKDVPFDKKMLTGTYEGITLQPIYRRENIAGLAHVNSLPGFAPFVRGTSAAGYLKQSWDVSQELSFAGASDFNHAAHASLHRGLNALNVVLDRATRNGHDPDTATADEVGVAGLSIASLDDLQAALQGIHLDKISLFMRCGASALPMAALLAALARKRGQSPAALRGCIEMDPLGVLSHEGSLPQSLPSAYHEMAALTKWASARAPQLQTICVHSRSWHEAGGNAVQELAFTLASGVEYLRQMGQRELDVDTVAPKIRFAVTVGINFFMEIAKLRALRLIWSRAVAAAGGNENAQKLRLHVRTALWDKTVNDPHNNMLRATVEAFAGLLGSCDSMQVGAFDEVVRTPDEFSQRVARNTQLVLQKECNLDRVIDPAGGSWLIETLTAELAGKAWALFQEVERQGGMEAALRAGFCQKAVAATAAEKIKAVTRRRDAIVGVNQYANAKEKPLEARAADDGAFYKRRVRQIASYRTAHDQADHLNVLGKLSGVVGLEMEALFDACVDAAAAGATLGEITRAIRISDKPGASIAPVCLTRAAVPFEQLRAAMNRQAAPRQVFLCNMGPPRDHKARADFASGFFSAGGYDVVSPQGFQTPQAAADAFGQSTAKIAVICSTDDKYPALVPPLAAALKAVRLGTVVVLAGLPADQVEAHKKAGVDEFIHIRADAVELLTAFHKKVGLL